MPPIPRHRRQVTKPATVGQAPLPLDIADTGAEAIGQGLQRLGAGVTNIGITLKQAAQKRQDIADMTERINATSLMNASGRNIQTKIETEPDYTKWDGFREEEFKALQNSISGNNLMSDKEKSLSMARLEAKNTEWISQLNLQQARTIVDTGQKTILAGLEMAYSTGSKSDQAIAEDAWNLMWPELFPNKVLAKEAHDDAVARGKRQFNNANVEHFRNLASANPELTISVLEDERADRKDDRGVISEEALSNEDITDIISHANTVAEIGKARAKEVKRDLINTTTSKAIGDFFKGTLSLTELQRQHDAGLIRDTDFKSMMKDLQRVAPEKSDPFSVGKVRRQTLDLAAGAIDRQQADQVLLREYSKLDLEDRESAIVGIEEAYSKSIATAVKNAYADGRSLMSRRFVGVRSEEDLLDFLRASGLSEEDKRNINRQFMAEVNNRDLYERAVDERVREMRAKKDVSANDIAKESLAILLQYQRRLKLTLDELEQTVKEEQARVILTPTTVPIPTLPPVDNLSAEDARAELKRIRKRKEQLRLKE
ncbi:hypothetical protein LCGC14_0434420 [marine sediment metagenome]|uniref:Uncharacterized protein n=1 Tax=marine sediment metagenome TaxID=412755 RepID=A0A0F9T5B0_9ZZZZ